MVKLRGLECGLPANGLRLHGRIRYIAPEEMQGKGPSPQSNVFRYGLILYELISGKFPFESVNAIDEIIRLLRDDPAPLKALKPEIPEALDFVVQRALMKVPELRYSNFAELLLDLQTVGADLI